ncbi:uncharacterized protein [Physcomitrium patens]|uniref:uncharacterized protein isoform X1 n=1 Tax=Physcomitrium patens TaxID=3218 RepID=UPI003CCD8520
MDVWCTGVAWCLRSCIWRCNRDLVGKISLAPVQARRLTLKDLTGTGALCAGLWFAAKGLTPSYGNMETCICDAYALWIVEALRRCIETH